MIKSFFDENNIAYNENVSLKNYNTYKIDTTCSYLVFPKNEQELINILKKIKENNIKYLILGNGSNIILSMKHYDGIVIKLNNFNNVEYKNDTTVIAEAGYSLIKLSLETIDKGLSGLEFASAIPGSVGASTAMNAGAYKCDMAQVVESVRVLNKDLKIEILKNQDLEYEYRDSFLKKNKEYIVLSTTFKLTHGDKEEMKRQIEERRHKRIETQPLNMPSAGSVFRNPENMYAGELIEKANLKGFSIGDAKVSEKHANFIVNNGNANGQDIIELISIIKKKIKDKYNIELKLEQIIIK